MKLKDRKEAVQQGGNRITGEENLRQGFTGSTERKLEDRDSPNHRGGNRINREENLRQGFTGSTGKRISIHGRKPDHWEEIRKKSFHPFQPAHQEETRQSFKSGRKSVSPSSTIHQIESLSRQEKINSPKKSVYQGKTPPIIKTPHGHKRKPSPYPSYINKENQNNNNKNIVQ